MTSVFDLDGALERVEGDRELLGELARLYLDEVSTLLVAISDAMKKDDILAAANAAHTMKGASSNFCARAMYDAAWGFEQMRSSNTADEIAVAYQKLLQESELLNQAIRQEFAI